LVGDETPASKLYQVFEKWMKGQGLFPWSQKRLSGNLEQKGHKVLKKKTGNAYEGVFVKPELLIGLGS
jgi:phage/plasmid-associated DNA primase